MNGTGAAQSIRIDRLLVYLRFARTRSAAQALIDTRALRCNRKHVLRGSEQARIGDVLTLALGGDVRVVELVSLPQRRGSPAAARSHYRILGGAPLDPEGQFAIAATPLAAAHPPGDPAVTHPKEPQ
jgi:ribosome-associated heat shock protein Hsp15